MNRRLYIRLPPTCAGCAQDGQIKHDCEETEVDKTIIVLGMYFSLTAMTNY